MIVPLQPWDICALRPANDNEKWSYRKAFLFVAGSSSLVWTFVFLLLRLAALP